MKARYTSDDIPRRGGRRGGSSRDGDRGPDICCPAIRSSPQGERNRRKHRIPQLYRRHSAYLSHNLGNVQSEELLPGVQSLQRRFPSGSPLLVGWCRKGGTKTRENQNGCTVRPAEVVLLCAIGKTTRVHRWVRCSGNELSRSAHVTAHTTHPTYFPTLVGEGS